MDSVCGIFNVKIPQNSAIVYIVLMKITDLYKKLLIFMLIAINKYDLPYF